MAKVTNRLIQSNGIPMECDLKWPTSFNLLTWQGSTASLRCRKARIGDLTLNLELLGHLRSQNRGFLFEWAF